MVTDVLLVLRNLGHTVSYTADHRFIVDGQVYTRDEFLALVDPSTVPLNPILNQHGIPISPNPSSTVLHPSDV